MAEEATYRTSTENGNTVYTCVVCEQAGTEHSTADLDYMRMHQEHRHGGVMVESKAPPEDHPHGGPPGQTGEHPEHPHGGPPGQTGEHPHDEEPHPAHPIVEPEEG